MHNLKNLMIDRRLQAAELRALMVLQQAADDRGFCYCTNEELAARLQVTPRYFAKLLAKLRKVRLITVTISNKKGIRGSFREIRLT